jgi:hypothetical protein
MPPCIIGIIFCIIGIMVCIIDIIAVHCSGMLPGVDSGAGAASGAWGALASGWCSSV